MDMLVIKALIAGGLIALMAGPLGSLVLWRRLAFFGDTLSHASLLGVVIGLIIGILPVFGIFLSSFVVALLLLLVLHQKSLSKDTTLALISQGALAIGLLSIFLYKQARLTLMDYLFGDILAITNQDLVIMIIGVILTLTVLSLYWHKLLATTLSPDLAAVDGINVRFIQGIFLFLLAFSVALSIKIVGVLLMSSLLIFPAATARLYAKTPEQMVIGAALFGISFIMLGISASFFFETPTSPSIVVCGLIVFLSSWSLLSLKR